MKEDSKEIKIKKTGSKPYFTLSSGQKRIWILYKLNPNSCFYNYYEIFELNGRLNYKILEKSFNDLIKRHESLRTNFQEIEGKPVQIIKKSAGLKLKINDLSSLAEIDKKQAKKKIVQKEITKPFVLETDQLIRVRLLKLADDKHILITVFHQIIVDGESMDIFFRELSALYNAYLENKIASLPPLPVQFKDYAEWERKYINSRLVKRQEKYWIKKLQGELPVLDLPINKTRMSARTYKGGTLTLEINKNTFSELKKLSKKTKATIFTILFTIFDILLFKITGQTDLIVGLILSTRKQPELLNVIGHFLNILPMRSNLSNNPTFFELLQKTKDNLLESIANGDYPFDRIVEKLNRSRDLSMSSIFNVVFQNARERKRLALLNIKPQKKSSDYDYGAAKFDLKVKILERNDNPPLIFFEYSADLFNQEIIRKISSIFELLIKNVISKPEAKISDYEIVTPKEKNFLLKKFNNTKSAYPKNKTIPQLFEAQVKKTPNNIAVEFQGQTLTYQELNAKANSLAFELRRQGLKAAQVVGILLNRSIETVVAVLAVLKAGGACLLVDIDYPQKRIEYIFKNSRALYLISRQPFSNRVLFKGKSIDIDGQDIFSSKNSNVKNINKPEDPAFIIYTSGSTGQPKGAIAHHGGLINQIFFKLKHFKITAKDIICFNHPIGFGPAPLYILLPLLSGSKLVIYGEEVIKDPWLLFKNINNDRITFIEAGTRLISAYLNSIRDGEFKKLFLTNLRVLAAAGEKLPLETADLFSHMYKKIKLINTYGQTEACGGQTLNYEFGFKNNQFEVVGYHPISNTQVYILDKYLNPTPVGLIGEIYISGDSLSHGYINNPQETKKRFLPHPFISDKKIFKTGDLAKRLPNGNIVILGRSDFQVKIRGNRIEMEEIEVHLNKIKSIKECVVIAKEDQDQQKYLVAYYTSQQPLPVSDIKAHLSQYLPDYMIPSYFVHLSQLPLTPSGKIDRSNLPAPDETAIPHSDWEEPKTAIEKVLIDVWKEALKIDKISVNDNIFDLGGNSLKAIEAVAKLMAKKINIQLRDFFDYPRLKDLAAKIEDDLIGRHIYQAGE